MLIYAHVSYNASYTLGIKHFVGDVEYKDHIKDANGNTDPQTSVYE